jgi:hypothetical protein
MIRPVQLKRRSFEKLNGAEKAISAKVLGPERFYRRSARRLVSRHYADAFHARTAGKLASGLRSRNAVQQNCGL